MADFSQDQNRNEHRDPSQGWQQPDFQNGPQNEYRNPYNPYPPKRKKTRNGFATSALICGMLALINLCCFAFTTAIIFGVGAISFAFISRKDNKFSTPARIAIFLGCAGIVFGVLEYFYAIKLIEYMKAPENIAQFNQMYLEIEKFLMK